MKLVCLTGGIASGKSAVAEMLRQEGARVEDADRLAKELVAQSPLKEELTKVLGRTFFDPDGGLKTRELAAYIFHHPDALRKVNALVHPRVRDELRSRYESVREKPGCFVVETALAIESGYHEEFEVVVVVTADRTERLRRMLEDKGLTADQAVARMAAQLPQEEKVKVADHVIPNDGSIDDLRTRVRELHERLCLDE